MEWTVRWRVQEKRPREGGEGEEKAESMTAADEGEVRVGVEVGVGELLWAERTTESRPCGSVYLGGQC